MVRTVAYRRSRYAEQGLWRLVDQRAVRTWEATGRADTRVVEVIRQVLDSETDTSTGTRGRLIPPGGQDRGGGPRAGGVPLPGRTTFYKLLDALSTGQHTFGSAVTRRQAANRPERPFTPTFAARPGEQVHIDSTRIDMLVLLDTGLPVRADLTITVDIATRPVALVEWAGRLLATTVEIVRKPAGQRGFAVSRWVGAHPWRG